LIFADGVFASAISSCVDFAGLSAGTTRVVETALTSVTGANAFTVS
jgi:hypothetical protein